MKNLKRILALALALCMLCSVVPMSAFAATNQPFENNSANNPHYRIPALIRVGDALVAAADRRNFAWDSTDDNSDIDTVVAISTDNGANWNVTTVNDTYYNSTSNIYQSGTYIDPALATDGTKVYMLVDLFPGQNAEKNSAPNASIGTGMDANGNLLLSTDRQNYDYYLKDGRIYNNAGVDQGYAVDAEFNFTSGDKSGNLFNYNNGSFYPLMTSYLCMVIGTYSNGSITWTDRTLINNQVKNIDEKYLVDAPGAGLHTKNGHIVFPVYSVTNANNTERSSLIYSTDGGVSWKRTDKVSTSAGMSSEGELVELSDGTLRYFYRHYGSTTYNHKLMYVDATWNGTTYTWGTPVNTGITCNSSVDIGAITYSKTMDGKQVIMVSVPGGTSGQYDRTAGKIYTFTVGDGNALELVKTYNFNNNAFGYSCMTVKSDDTIGLMYENGDSGNITFTTIDPVADMRLTFGEDDDGEGDDDDEGITIQDVQVEVGKTVTYTDESGNYQDSYSEEGLNKAIATVAVTGVTGTAETTVSTTPATELEAGATYIIRLRNYSYALSSDAGRTDWGTQTLAFQVNNLTANTKHMWTLEQVDGGYKVKNVNGYLNLGQPAAGKEGSNAAFLNATGEVFTIELTANGWTFMNPYGQYINNLGNGNNTAGGWKSGSTTLDLFKVNTAVDTYTKIAITGVSAGKTSVTVGNTQYNIVVVPAGYQKVDVTLKVGESTTITDNTGNYEATYTGEGLDETIAKVEVKGVAAGTTITPVTALVQNESFFIQVGDGVYLKKDCSTTTSLDEAETWYVSASYEGSYKVIKNSENQSLAIDNSGNIYLFSNGDWNHYLLDLKNGFIGRYNSTITTTAKPVKVTESSQAVSTDITITGVSKGETYAIVGNTLYNIKVVPTEIPQKDVTVHVGETTTITDKTGNYEATYTGAGLDKSIATVVVKGTTADGKANATPVTQLAANDKFYIQVSEGTYLTASLGTTTTVAEENLWTVVSGGGDWGVVKNSKGEILAINGDKFVLGNAEYYLWMNNGLLGDDFGNLTIGTPVKLTVTEVVDATDITITGVSVGKTSVVVGDTLYNIEVVPTEIPQKDVTVYVGQTTTITDPTGNYEESYTGEGLDEDIATVEVQNTTVEGSVIATPITSLTVGESNTFYIQVSDGVYLTPSAGTTTNLSEAGHWYASENYSNYCVIRSASTGAYLGDGYNTEAYLHVADSILYMKMSNGTLQGWYSNEIAGTPVTITTTEPVDATDITITGVSVGKTSVMVGNTQYNITVKIQEKNLTMTTGGVTTVVPVAPVTQADIDAFNAANGTYVTAELKANGNVQLTAVAEGTVEDYLMCGTKYNIQIIRVPDCVTSQNSPFVVGGNFIGSVTNDPKNEGMDYLTKLTMSDVMTKENLGGGSGVGYPVALNSAFENAENISWSIADESIAKIEVSADGKSVYVTSAAAGTTYLSCTIDGETYSIPVVIIETTDTTNRSSWKYVNLHIAEITRTDVWYSWNCSGDVDQFVPAIEGEAIYAVYDKTEKYCINYYAAPDAHHALTFMSATNSDGEYHTLNDKSNPKNCDFYTLKGAGYDQRNGVGFTDDQVAGDIQAGLDLGCDGAQGFSRADDVNAQVNCNLTFISDPMPELTKGVNGILPLTRVQRDFRTYFDGMVATVGEYVYFELIVTLGRPDVWKDEAQGIGSIEYSAAKLIDDVLEGAYFYTKELDQADGKWDGEVAPGSRVQVDDITDELNKAWAADETVRTLQYYVVYEIKTEDIPKFIIENTAKLDWDYHSHYSTGTLGADAEALASITVVGSDIDDVVIDFGQTVVYEDLTTAQLKYANTGKFASKYGEFTVEGVGEAKNDGTGVYYDEYKVTYTPTSILHGPDTVIMRGTYIDPATHASVTKIINGFVVYPATTVYYEEGFMLNADSTWNAANAKMATGEQTLELLGKSQFDENGLFTDKISDKKNAYGYDPLYTENGYTYGNSYAESTEMGQTTTFTFTGTGFDLYANCTQETGYVAVQVKNSAGKFVKLYTVDTIVKGGSTVATQEHEFAEYHLPIVSVDLGTHDTYTVTVNKIMDTEPVRLDGIRIHNTLADSSVYNIDQEDNPELYQLRDYVLTAVDVNKTASEDYGEDWLNRENDLIGPLAEQVYGTISTDSEAPLAVVTSTGATTTDVIKEIYGEGATVQDLLDNGPKNELFLYPGQTLTFKVSTSRAMQIGLKAPSAATGYKVTYTPEGGTKTEKSGTLGTSVDMFYALENALGTEVTYTVSVTNTGDQHILSVTDLKICDDPNAAFVPLTVGDIEQILKDTYFGADEEVEPEIPVEPEVPEEPSEPVVPEEPTEPEQPTKPQKPVNPWFSNWPQFSLWPQLPGKPVKPEVSQSEASLKVMLVDYKGDNYGTVTLTAQGTDGEDHVFTAQEILAAAEEKMPARYALVSDTASDVNVAYGKEQTVKIQIGKVATLQISFVNLRGQQVGTATITKVQTSAGRCVISGAEIREIAPAGKYVMWMLPTAVYYGSNYAMTVRVF